MTQTTMPPDEAVPEEHDDESARRRSEWNPVTRYQTSMQMSDKARRQLAAIAEQLGISRAAVLEMAVRTLHRKKFPRET